MLPPGEFKKHVRAIEHGCIWMDMKTKEKVVFHIEPAAGKYYRALSDMMGLQWHTMDYLSLGNGIFLRARAFMKTYYDVGQSTDGKKYFRHDVTSDLGVDGTLYYVLMINEIVIVLINAADVGIVAMIAVRPLLRSKRTSVYSTDSTSTSTNTPVSLKKLSVQLQNRGSKSQVYVRTESVQLKQSEKNSTLSKMLLYTDLTSVSYHKPLLSMLLVVDTPLSWLWVVPNSNVFAWATIAFQVGSAYLSMFRVWIIVLILIDDLWKWTFVFVHEKLAALITEFTYVKSFEIMCATLIGIYIAYDDIMNICVLKYGLVDGQRAMTPTSPTLASFYNSYTQYSWGDRSNDHEALYYIYKHSPRSLSTAYYSAFRVAGSLAGQPRVEAPQRHSVG
ncbi:hypothetical protein Poli38472_007312 [Pythium oligandrum]|uniref:Uncharacterized protein n=1 Tax=Pythium oligandrum TaxID=41045 RepID=A0A8K1C9Q6_PYTOL|nr:hypothetical protein Poli38472_007312 [Pythium oligandrum]|eukprot:TMW59167.1 hypothetical protein Poli38472_007312 [Pythium oligandrum]